MVVSGTATLETALLGVPMVIVYKAHFLTYILTRLFIKLKYIGLVNVIAGRKIVPEFLQYEANPGKISDYILRLLNDKALGAEMKTDFAKLRQSLGKPGASKRAASRIVDFLR
jgi:lipid-A-disaccharide synthase